MMIEQLSSIAINLVLAMKGIIFCTNFSMNSANLFPLMVSFDISVEQHLQLTVQLYQ